MKEHQNLFRDLQEDFRKMKKNLLVAQSGGPTAAINATLAGVIKQAIKEEQIDQVYGACYGIQGVLEQKFVNLTEKVDTEEKLEKLKRTPAAALGSCRFKLNDIKEDDSQYQEIVDILHKMNIGYFVYIGGNDSMDTVGKMSMYVKKHQMDVKVIGIPKTIDNDLVVTDHTPGFGSAARYVAASILEMAHDTYIYNTRSVLIAEIMGRDAGWLTASSVLARNSYSQAPHLIYLPEHPFSKEQFIEDIREQFEKREHIVIAVSEGLRDEKGQYISAETSAVDAFGHATLSGTGKCLENLVAETFGCKVRSVEINVLQRCAAHMASATDIEESWQLGLKGVSLALEGRSGEMSIVRRISDEPYQVVYEGADVQQIANAEKKIPAEWINEAGNDVTEEMVRYLRPLIHGKVNVPEKDSMPYYLFLGEAL